MFLNDAEIECLKSEYDVDADKISEYLQLIFEESYNEVNMNVKNPVNINFKLGWDINKINAKADENEDPFIQIQYANYLIANKLFNTLFSENNKAFYELISFNNTYNEEDAKKWSSFMKKLTFNIILFHEFGHIYGGHLKKDDASKASLVENESIVEDGNIIFYQARELDADRFAAYNLIAYYISDTKIKRYFMNDGIKFKGKEHALVVLIYAAILVCSILGAGKKYPESFDYKKIMHLPNRFRAKCYFKNMSEAYEKNHNTKFSSINESNIVEIIVNVEKWFDYYMRDVIKVNNWSPENNNDLFDEEHISYYNKIEKYRENEFSKHLNPKREGIAVIKDTYISENDVFCEIAKRDGGKMFFY